MENKYYIPSIEELHVGYECEILNNNGNWGSISLTPYQLMGYLGDMQGFTMIDPTGQVTKIELRTPYLTKEQIEAERWLYLKDEDVNTCVFKHYKKLLGMSPVDDKHNYLYYNIKTNMLYVYLKWDDGNEEETIFSGTIKSINEFRKIISYLGI